MCESCVMGKIHARDVSEACVMGMCGACDGCENSASVCEEGVNEV